LDGRVRIVLTREEGMNESIVQWLPRDATISTVPLTTTRFFDVDAVAVALAASPFYGSFRSVVVTSARSCVYVALALEASLADVDIYSVGSTTTAALGEFGVSVTAQAHGAAATLANDIEHGPVLLIGAAAMRDELPVALRAKSVDVTVLACYETLALDVSHEQRSTLGSADVVLIGAPSAWRVAQASIGPNTWVVVPGASTGDVVRSSHERVLEGWGPALRTQLAELG
jgi:uroporphyrinogen-III synthase